MASVILYGLLRRIRSSQVLEYMTGHNVDFMGLTEGRMKLLLDTHAVLWWLDDPLLLSMTARLAIAEPATTCW